MPSKTVETFPQRVALEALRVDLAVFVNGTMVRYLDYNDAT